MPMHSNYTFKQGENYLIFSEYFLHFAEILLITYNVCMMPVFRANHQSSYYAEDRLPVIAGGQYFS